MQQRPVDNHKHTKAFEELMDCVCSDLFHGSAWHCRVGNEMRKIGLRGWGRMHDYNAKHDFCKRQELEKILRDRLDMAPDINTEGISAAVSATIKGVQDLKPHMEMWLTNETEFSKQLIEAVRAAASVDMCIYERHPKMGMDVNLG